ncbi:AraC family transcriptional regulator [Pseudomonas sp. 5P_3.1_Bac2]|uniref:AraC family transcriptional regulator n=1 Tax=Pseudomonas sp. 5P_3.1_Bac2 TaxID=2971617 RepID=UPI0021C8BCFD|nr:AraC family transcriptional regulator [Pseudomonas sp. 5P_3.1_Bac2]MCU1717381.1 AraC family transcriptional regulator [Pseudomonas sp. 5P_3.1_Bac2]
MSTHQLSQMIQARALMGFAELLTSQGLSLEQLLSECEISLAAIENPDLPIPLDHLAKLYERCAQVLNWADLGLRIVQFQDISMYGPLAQIMLNASSVGAALEGLTKHFAYHTPGAAISIVPASDPRYIEVQYVLLLSPGIAHRQITEQSFGMACKLWRMLVALDSTPPQVRMRHAQALPLAQYQAHFACPVQFEQSVDAIWLPLEQFDQPIDQADPQLRQASEAYIAGIIRRFPLDLGKQVETLIIQQLALGGASIAAIAKQLGLQQRTLQRRLAQQGIVFADLLDSLRRSQARLYLANAGLPLAAVSALLGYNEQSSFIRACKRWFGQTPQQLRSAEVSHAN